jgi:hypothetical protein
MMESGRYHASVTTEDVWICYPWEAKYAPLYVQLYPSKALEANDLLSQGH